MKVGPIEQVPMPRPKKGPGSISKYGLDDMEIGDSRFISDTQSNNPRTAVHHWARSKGRERQFTTRITIEGGVRGMRIWRVK